MAILLTGVAGFIGQAVAKALLAEGREVIGVDNLSDYYDVGLKQARLQELEGFKNFHFHKMDICDHAGLLRLASNVDLVIHLAAQAGVRYSLENPFAYVKNNVEGFLSILEVCRHLPQRPKLVYASSSSVYGANTKIPFAISDEVKSPISLYAASKLADEHMAFTYSHLFSINSIGLRFFTVYGPWGRPDMAPFKFTKAIFAGEPIDVYNNGNMKRDFTYIDDIVAGVIGAVNYEVSGHKIYNLGNHKPVDLKYFIQVLEKQIGKKARMNLLPMQPGEVIETYADISESERDLKFFPHTAVEEGLAQLVKWYKGYAGV